MCDKNSFCDVTLVGDDGNVFAHKLILLKVFPELKYLLCAVVCWTCGWKSKDLPNDTTNMMQYMGHSMSSQAMAQLDHLRFSSNFPHM